MYCLCFTPGPVQGPGLVGVVPALPFPGQSGLKCILRWWHWGSERSREAIKGHTWVWEERNSPKMSATASTPLLKQWLAWQIQLFGYLGIPGACLCSLLSHLAGEVCFQSGTISSSSFWQQNCVCLHF